MHQIKTNIWVFFVPVLAFQPLIAVASEDFYLFFSKFRCSYEFQMERTKFPLNLERIEFGSGATSKHLKTKSHFSPKKLIYPCYGTQAQMLKDSRVEQVTIAYGTVKVSEGLQDTDSGSDYIFEQIEERWHLVKIAE